MKLSELHHIIQIAMGWTDSHLHQFIVDGKFYGEPNPDFGFEVVDENEIRLDKVASSEGAKFIYEYDFGDGWEHEVVLEKVLPLNPSTQYPRCTKGKRNCPPEDIGGIGGYEYYLEAIKDKNHPEHESYSEWGGDFDSEEFDPEEVNVILTEFWKG